MAANSAEKDPSAKPYMWMNLATPALLPQNRIWEKSYRMDKEMHKSLLRTLGFLNLDMMAKDRKILFEAQYRKAIDGWIFDKYFVVVLFRTGVPILWVIALSAY